MEERAWAPVRGNEPGYEARNTLFLCVHRSCSLPDDVDQNKPSYATCRGPQVVHIFHSSFRKYQCEFIIEPILSVSAIFVVSNVMVLMWCVGGRTKWEAAVV